MYFITSLTNLKWFTFKAEKNSRYTWNPASLAIVYDYPNRELEQELDDIR